jgi:tetratricopeptide (TPR) repeat protein
MNKWISIAIVFVLSGCAGTPEAVKESDAEISPQQALEPRVNRNTVIDEEVLYLLMAAELAGQRNQYDLAMDAYLQAAKRVDDARIAERAVKIGMFLKDEKRTREALAVWLAKDGQNLAARKFAVLLAIKNADRKAAVDNLNAILLDDPAGFEGGMLEMVKALDKDGHTQFIYDVLEDLALQNPDQASVLFVQAAVASVLHKNELAQQKITRVLELQPDWNKALIFQAQLAGRSGDMPKARQYLEKAVKQAPDDRQL